MQKREYRIIIAGSRHFLDYEALKKMAAKVIQGLLKNDPGASVTIISGTARGTDQLGERFAEEFGYPVKRFPADWKLYGKSAGFVRNRQMLLYAKETDGALIAFWDGKSRGTANMIRIAKDAKMPVYTFLFTGEQ